MSYNQQDYPENHYDDIEQISNDVQMSNDIERSNGIQKKPKPKRSLVFKFFKAFGISLGVFMFCAVAVVFAYNLSKGNDLFDPAIAQDIDSNLKRGGSILDVFAEAEMRTNFVILGVDRDKTRTDVMIVGCFNSKTKEINLVSVPRDTYTVMPEERRDILKEQNLWTPANGVMKLNEVHHYAGKKNGVEFIVKQLEELMDIQISYYVKVDLDAFEFIIDEVGGVEFDVPCDMKYTDIYQDLYIDLKAGLQTLDGDHAMQLVRYRSYPGEDDWMRSETQKDLIKALLSQIASDGNLLKNAPALIKTAYEYIETNMDIADALKYVKYIGELKSENIISHSLKEGAVDAKAGGKDVIKLDTAYVSEVVDEVFYSFDGEDEIVPSADKKIQILNGGIKGGIASKNKEFVESNGFTVDNIGDYPGTKADYTRIFVNKKGTGKDIKELYPGSKLIVDSKIAKDYDIVIVLGTNEE